MSKKNIITKIKALFNEEIVEEKFTDVKTSDGKILHTPAESLVEGADIVEILEDGTQAPVADGEYVLEDGTTITVTESKITGIAAPAEQEKVEEEEVLAEDIPEENPEETPEEQPEEDEIQKRVKSIEKKLDTLIIALGLMSEQFKAIEEQFKAVENKIETELTKPAETLSIENLSKIRMKKNEKDKESFAKKEVKANPASPKSFAHKIANLK